MALNKKQEKRCGMVTNRRNICRTGLAVTAILLLIIAVAFIRLEKSTFLGVQTISETQYNNLKEYALTDLDPAFEFNGIPAAVDSETNTIYISQNHRNITSVADFEGALTVKNPDFTIKLLKDNAFENPGEAVKNNRPFTLVVYSSTKEYTLYNIVISTLPVINISGDFSGYNENGEELFYGGISFWDGFDEEYNSYRTEYTNVEWRKRGQTSSGYSKNPWKLSLKNNKGENKNLSLCGLGADDDWILNAMALDDLNIREKLAMDLCSEIEQQTGNVMATKGEYVELVLNGNYKGLYIIMRRIDGKYLNLDDDILLKGTKFQVDKITADTYGKAYTPYSEAETNRFLDNYFVNGYERYIDLNSYMDIVIMIQYGSMIDNGITKNIYYHLSDLHTDYKVKLLLWDVDMSFGLSYSNGFVYRLESSINSMPGRMEQGAMKELYPDLTFMMADRWSELRESVLEPDNVKSIISDNYTAITQSGSMQRDFDRWGLYYNGEDTIDNLYSFVDRHTERMDTYYSQYIR